MLFSGSLRMNIDPMEHHTDDQIWRALEHAHIKDFIQHLPSKLDYDCGEGGQNLRYFLTQRFLFCFYMSVWKTSGIILRTLFKKSGYLISKQIQTADYFIPCIYDEFTSCYTVTSPWSMPLLVEVSSPMVSPAK